MKLVALPDANKAHDVRPHLTRAVLDIPSPLRLSMTWNRGREMAEHLAFTAATGMPVYFCESRSPWQRGSNETAFNATLKRETLQGAHGWPDPRTACLEVFRWITRYNTRRRHSLLGHTSPIDYEKTAGSLTAAA